MGEKLLVLPGDGIGPEVVDVALEVIQKVASTHSVEIETDEALIGGIAIDETGDPLPPQTLEKARKSDAILLGAVGGPKWDTTDPDARRPEEGLLGIRKGLGLFANLRPVTSYESLIKASPLRADIAQGIDLVVVRELTGGIYFGERGRLNGGSEAFDTCSYSKVEVERVVRAAFDMARGRRKKLHSIDKANVLETSRLWREVVLEVAPDYPDVTLEHQLVDNAAMQLIRYPTQYDVLVTENLFGDILSDEAAMLTGSIGMLPSASLAASATPGRRLGLYEPVHGSAPDIAGTGKANPLATVLSCAMMFRYSFAMEDAAAQIDEAVDAVLDMGLRTPDIAPGADSGQQYTPAGTAEMGAALLEALS